MSPINGQPLFAIGRLDEAEQRLETTFEATRKADMPHPSTGTTHPEFVILYHCHTVIRGPRALDWFPGPATTAVPRQDYGWH